MPTTNDLFCTVMSIPSKVAEFEDSGFRVEQEVLGFDVSMADSIGMDVG